MTLKVAINGFGRIGRLVLRCILQKKDIEVVAINDLVGAENLAYLLKFDSTHGQLKNKIEFKDNELIIDDKVIKTFAETDPLNLPWQYLNIDYVIEATGHFNTYEKASFHLDSGAKRVVLTAPAKSDEVPTFVMGVNHTKYDPKKDFIVSNASCTTNCLAPITKVLIDNFGIEEGLMTTVHALTATQATVDSSSKKDFRAGRGALQNIIPSSTGAAKAVGLCIPEIKGKLTGMAFRVPVANVSCVDLTVKLEKSTTLEKICTAMKKASETEMKNILQYCDEDVVSSDFIGSSFSSIFDSKASIALNEKFYKIISWYDNEMGYSQRVVDLLEYMHSCE